MGRRFTAASNERVYVGAAGLGGLNFTFGTFAAVVNFASFTAAGTILATNDQTSPSFTCYFASGNGLKYYDGTTDTLLIASGSFSTAVTYVIAVTKATGTATARSHLYVPSTNTWTHAAAAATTVNSATNTSLSIGTFADNTARDPIDADIFAVALWQGVVMTDSECERLARGNWANSAPDFHEEWIQHGHELGDMTSTLGRRTVKQTTRTGTTRGTTRPPAGFRPAVQRRRR